jgi:hypothetical protein
MSEIAKWLVHDDQKALWEFLVAAVLNVIFLGFVALVLWPLERLSWVVQLAKGYGLLWVATLIVFVLTRTVQRLFRIDMYQRANAFVFSNLVFSCLLVVGWSAFVGLAMRGLTANASVVVGIALYAIGALSCLVACFVIGSFYQGTIYRLVNLPVAMISFFLIGLLR